MQTKTTDAPNHDANHSAWRNLTAIVVFASVAVLTVAVTPARAQTGPIVNEFAKILASDGAAGDVFGYSVAISGDTAVIGAFEDDDNGMNSGSAYVFVRDANGVWTQQTKLLASDGAAGDAFGASVAITGDRALIGAAGDSDNGSFSGSAYVFTRDANGVWMQQAKLLPGDGAENDQFGIAVALSGETALIGARFDDDNGMDSGSAYVFVPNANGVWSQQAKLLASDGAAFDFFGALVALSGDTAVVGAFNDNDLGNSSGSAYIFVREAGGVWTQQTKLLASDGSGGNEFGRSVAISGDTAVIGAHFGVGVTGVFGGAAYVFTRDDAGVWTQQVKLSASDEAPLDDFGFAVAISGDTAVVGADGDDDNGPGSGSAYLFTRNANGVWTQQDKLLASDGAQGDLFGAFAALSGDTVVVGAFKDADNGMDSGSAYIFNLGSAADLNGDGVVDGADLASLLTQWGTNGPADLNGDGVVDGADLAQLLTNWGPV